MTKKEMIETIQKEEAKRWETLRYYDRVSESEDEYRKKALCRWGTIHRLMKDLGIERRGA
jgi:hypothetical protein